MVQCDVIEFIDLKNKNKINKLKKNKNKKIKM